MAVEEATLAAISWAAWVAATQVSATMVPVADMVGPLHSVKT